MTHTSLSQKMVDSSTFLFSCPYCENNCERLKNVMLFDVPKTSLRKMGNRHSQPPEMACPRERSAEKSSSFHTTFFPNGRDYVFMSDRPFYFEPIKRAPRRIEDTRCFWDLTGNLALRARRYIPDQ